MYEWLAVCLLYVHSVCWIVFKNSLEAVLW
jgi:hypothetical protein